MSTKQQLRARWKTLEGKQRAEALYQAFDAGTTLEQLHTLVDTLSYTDEVSPNLDLRGLQLEDSIFVHHLDLPRVRLDYSTLSGNLSSGNWERAVFDGADVTGLTFHLDLTEASFVKANARKVWFLKSTLNEANFSEAKLIGAYLEEVPCKGANFSGADLRSSSCGGADFRGVDLSGANFAGASCGFVLFDADTKIEGANFTGTVMTDDFRVFVTEANKQPVSREQPPDFEVAVFDATIVLLQQINRDGSLDHLLEVVTTIRQRIKEDADYNWEPFLEENVPANLQALFFEAYEDGMGQAEHYM